MRHILRCAAVLLVAGCNGPDPLVDTIVPGTVSFDFTGAGHSAPTTFGVDGSVSITNPEWGTTPFAAAQTNSSIPFHTLVAGGYPKSTATWDQILLTVTRVSVGSSTIPGNCTGFGPCILPGIEVDFSANHATSLGVPTYVCTILNGTISITAITERRVAGTFSGTGLCTEGGNAQTPFSITNGAFDVGILISGKPIPKA